MIHNIARHSTRISKTGVSFYSYDKICTLLKLDVDDYIQARDGLMQKRLIAFDGRQFQVLALPGQAPNSSGQPSAPAESNETQALRTILARLASKQGDLA